MAINKIIHHIWTSGDRFRYPFNEFRKTWMEHNPYYTFMFWDLTNQPLKLLTPTIRRVVYDTTIPWIVKSDVLRWDLLRIFGGIVPDTDMKCLKNFDCFLQHKSFCGKLNDEKPLTGLIGSEPDNPIIVEACKFIGESVLSNRSALLSRDGIIATSGPHAMRPFLEKLEIIYPQEFFYELTPTDKSYATHYWTNIGRYGWTSLLTGNPDSSWTLEKEEQEWRKCLS